MPEKTPPNRAACTDTTAAAVTVPLGATPSNTPLSDFKEDDVISCPYNNAHQILITKIQTHLTKCRENYESKGKKVCPYNSMHSVELVEYQLHCDRCPERTLNNGRQVKIETRTETLALLPVENRHIATSEDWEADLAAAAPVKPPIDQFRNQNNKLQAKKGGTPSNREPFHGGRRRPSQELWENRRNQNGRDEGRQYKAASSNKGYSNSWRGREEAHPNNDRGAMQPQFAANNNGSKQSLHHSGPPAPLRQTVPENKTPESMEIDKKSDRVSINQSVLRTPGMTFQNAGKVKSTMGGDCKNSFSIEKHKEHRYSMQYDPNPEECRAEPFEPAGAYSVSSPNCYKPQWAQAYEDIEQSVWDTPRYSADVNMTSAPTKFSLQNGASSTHDEFEWNDNVVLRKPSFTLRKKSFPEEKLSPQEESLEKYDLSPFLNKNADESKKEGLIPFKKYNLTGERLSAFCEVGNSKPGTFQKPGPEKTVRNMKQKYVPPPMRPTDALERNGVKPKTNYQKFGGDFKDYREPAENKRQVKGRVGGKREPWVRMGHAAITKKNSYWEEEEVPRCTYYKTMRADQYPSCKLEQFANYSPTPGQFAGCKPRLEQFAIPSPTPGQFAGYNPRLEQFAIPSPTPGQFAGYNPRLGRYPEPVMKQCDTPISQPISEHQTVAERLVLHGIGRGRHSRME